MNIPISSYQFFSTLTGFLESLEVLHIRHPYRNKPQALVGDLSNLTDGIRIFKFCHNLKRLSLQDIPFPRDVFHLPWTEIQHFSAHSSLNLISNSVIFKALQGFRNLTSCLLECRLVAKSHKAQQLMLPVLHSMTLLSVDDNPEVTGAFRTGAAQIISWLTLPVLENLQLRHRSRKESEAELVFELIRLIRRSRCGIRELHLRLSPPMSDTGVVSILKEISPSLEKLSLLCLGETSEFLQQIQQALCNSGFHIPPLRFTEAETSVITWIL